MPLYPIIEAGAAGSDTELQYNSGGALAGAATLTYVVGTGLLTYAPTLDEATGNEIAFDLNYTTNKGAGNDTGLRINQTDTLSPGTSYLIDAQVGGSSKFVVDNAGNVGVGTSTPATNLDITNSTTATGIRVTNTDDGAGNKEYAVFDWTTTANVLTIGTVAAGTGTQRDIEILGDVGIGTSNILATLHVDTSNSSVTPLPAADDLFIESAGQCGITIGTGNTQKGNIFFGDPQDADRGRIIYNHSSDQMDIWVDAAHALIIDGSQNVGLKTSTPTTDLDITNSTTATGIRVSNTDDGAGNEEYGVFDFTTTSNTLVIGTAKAGSGTTRDVTFYRNGQVIKLESGGIKLFSDVYASADNARSNGSATKRWSNLFSMLLTLDATATTDTAPTDDTTNKKLSIQRLSSDPTNAAFIKFSNSPGSPTNDFYLVLEEG